MLAENVAKFPADSRTLVKREPSARIKSYSSWRSV